MATASHDFRREPVLTAPEFLRPAESDPPDAGKLDGGVERVDAEHQTEDVDLDALLHAGKDVGEAEQGSTKKCGNQAAHSHRADTHRRSFS